MFMAIDIGNTHTVLGVYSDEKLLLEQRLVSAKQRPKSEFGNQVQSYLSEAGIDINSIKGIGISSVVPKLTDIFTAVVRDYFHQEPFLVSTALDLGIKINYDDPLSVGADRLCNVIAGYEKYGGPLIIIDFGTATTYDIVASNGDFLGGVIAPGIETSAAELHQRAAQLPKVDLHIPERAIGTNTQDSMQTGILWGAIDAVIGMVHRIQNELQKRESKEAVVIATGGFSKFVAKHAQIIQHVETSLVLDGIRLIYKRSGYRENELK